MKSNDMRRRIAHEAARMIAGDGGIDYGSAKRKAARQLGAPDSRNLPDNAEIEEALRSYQALYQNQEQTDALGLLREIAVEYMELLQDFDPHLTGSVLNGTAGRHSDINLQLFTDSDKELEFFLMNRKIAYQHGETRTDGQDYPHFSIDDPRAAVEVTVYPHVALRQMKRNQPDGSPRRVRLTQARSLFNTAADPLSLRVENTNP
jgi:hypothetical protein